MSLLGSSCVFYVCGTFYWWDNALFFLKVHAMYFTCLIDTIHSVGSRMYFSWDHMFLYLEIQILSEPAASRLIETTFVG